MKNKRKGKNGEKAASAKMAKKRRKISEMASKYGETS